MSYSQLPKVQNFIQIANQGKRCLIDTTDQFGTATAEYASRKILREGTKVERQAELDRLSIKRGKTRE